MSLRDPALLEMARRPLDRAMARHPREYWTASAHPLLRRHFRHRSINRNSAVASGSSFFNGWRSTPGTTPLTSQLALLISTTTTKVEAGSNAARLRLRSLTWTTGQPPSVRMDDEGATTSAARPIASPTLGV